VSRGDIEAFLRRQQVLFLVGYRRDGPLLRAKNAAAQTALNAQLRADENRLQQPQDDDGLARVLKLIAEEEARMRGTIIDESPIGPDQSGS